MNFNVISFSLYGDNPKYYKGMLENIILRPRIYPQWRIWIFADSANAKKLEEDQKLRGHWFNVIVMPDSVKQSGLFWRFRPAFEHFPDVERVIIRDADSRLNWRERAAVEEWMDSGKTFHIMRDHEHHTIPIMGGMWGCITDRLAKCKPLVDAWENRDWDGDQRFLTTNVWPLVKNDCVAHDRHRDTGLGRHGEHDCRPFPTDVGFIGEQIC